VSKPADAIGKSRVRKGVTDGKRRGSGADSIKQRGERKRIVPLPREYALTKFPLLGRHDGGKNHKTEKGKKTEKNANRGIFGKQAPFVRGLGGGETG